MLFRGDVSKRFYFRGGPQNEGILGRAQQRTSQLDLRQTAKTVRPAMQLDPHETDYRAHLVGRLGLMADSLLSNRSRSSLATASASAER